MLWVKGEWRTLKGMAVGCWRHVSRQSSSSGLDFAADATNRRKSTCEALHTKSNGPGPQQKEELFGWRFKEAPDALRDGTTSTSRFVNEPRAHPCGVAPMFLHILCVLLILKACRL